MLITTLNYKLFSNPLSKHLRQEMLFQKNFLKLVCFDFNQHKKYNLDVLKYYEFYYLYIWLKILRLHFMFSNQEMFYFKCYNLGENNKRLHF